MCPLLYHPRRLRHCWGDISPRTHGFAADSDIRAVGHPGFSGDYGCADGGANPAPGGNPRPESYYGSCGDSDACA